MARGRWLPPLPLFVTPGPVILLPPATPVAGVAVGGRVGGLRGAVVGGGEHGESGAPWVAWTTTGRGAARSCSTKKTFSA